MLLADSATVPVLVGMWGALITVTVLLVGTIVRATIAWSRLATSMDHLTKQFDAHLASERADRAEYDRGVEQRFAALETRLGRAERAIDDVRERLRRGRPT